ncbi:MAG: hypothetical protein VX209_00505 [Thermoproteota archaeon]|nr:hypothetical protein [Thermoproteota archaeon]
MDEKIRNIISDKLDEIFVKNDEISKIITSMDSLESKSLSYGIMIGRLYNSFYYQHRRILGRDPTTDEFLEFLEFVKSNQKNFQGKLGF